MFEFNDKFDFISGDPDLSLKIIEKNYGDDTILPFYWYEIISDGKAVGKISIRIGNNFHSYFNGHVGYEIDEQFRGNKLSLKALKLVLPVAKFHGMNSIYLTCSSSNMASKKIISMSGAVFLEEVVPPKEYFAWYEGIEKSSIFELFL